MSNSRMIPVRGVRLQPDAEQMRRLASIVGRAFTARLARRKAAPYVLWMFAAIGAAAQTPERFGFGEPAPRELIAALDTDVRPDGIGLPLGQGTAREGATLYAARCAACHGAKGEGGAADRLVGAEPKGLPPFGPAYEEWRGSRPDVAFTIGNYWPYATTVFDYVRRAMPPSAPGSLTPDETYAVVAWLLSQNGIIADDAVMNAQTLPKVVMPARKMFVPDDRKGGRTVR